MIKGNQPRIGLPVIVLGIASLLLVGLIFYNQVNAIKAARAELAAEQAALVQTSTRLQNLMQLKENSSEFSEKMIQIEKSLPADPQENELINDLNIISGKAGVELVQIRFENRVPQENFVEMPLKLSFQGSYNNLLNLLVGLQDSPRAMRIEAFKVSKDNQDRFVLRAEISASVFYAAQ